MRPTTYWKPNTSGLPDPFYNGRREYLEGLNTLAYNADLAVANRLDGDRLLNRVLLHEVHVPSFDPDTFHPTAGYAVPKRERGLIKEVR